MRVPERVMARSGCGLWTPDCGLQTVDSRPWTLQLLVPAGGDHHVGVAHAGEDVGPESIWSSIKNLQVSRIGHGISAIQDEKLMDYLKETQLPLEICPMSNIFTKKYVTSYKNHPIRKFYDRGLLYYDYQYVLFYLDHLE